jgi:PAS domain-containing protein
MRYGVLLDVLPAAASVTDEKGRIVFFNRAAEALAGK